MSEKKNRYEPPKMKVYQFDEEIILTSSAGVSTPGTNPTTPPGYYAADSLNKFMGGTNTTIEK